MKKRVAIYGSTGSIGTQALEVIEAHPDLFELEILTAHSNADLLIQQAKKHKPNIVIISDESKYQQVNEALSSEHIKVFAGEKSLIEMAASDNYDILLAAIVGFAGLSSTIAALQQGKTVALANKETLVVAGDIVSELVKKHHASLIPVDSEHSAIFQCIVGEAENAVEKIVLTASGGPFLGKKPNYLINVKKDHALQHPNWTMGAKITIDSASLMNKGLEMIEAKWLFGLQNEQIEVIVHSQSIIHSMVQFIDGSMKAQMGLPDMKLPIQYALAFPHRIQNDFKRFEFKNFPSLTFEVADTKTFRNLALAKEAMLMGGNAPCVLNAANEVVVDAFLKNKVGFLEMSDIIESCLEKVSFIEKPTLHDYIMCNTETRNLASSFIK
ncbi:MAG: 1-deoxy-D-xylulose-5-phosphate reductoisomerase [Bacteroidetes bacterium]|jgi:1-deoxy-D-xylulose-5-phosphate reductoisomerase|nr:1-deoxy-D-xylulose-5-phosphate reductoisomerase [Bacteroidota bacterium]HMT34725.1 1-deoxy-D-xylulose-5-phosphate reductoisomerase [Chitinophagaceae bacterium]MBK6818989.1 1-deoxy-D-xylulose-5-phosphate reductoisomerase [Bacteroidota bacterium]MBK7041868.1 1-deoxy-D-xylulose-5-phosphate reductoisomerase [Bacteroidota bacterium]MBK7588730.1 1-deoxy-D-xylulose-5-phosphate reductoisomerase [Bacteroidota bacterium]